MKLMPTTRFGVVWRGLVAFVVVVGCAAGATATAGLLQVNSFVGTLNIEKALGTKGITPPKSNWALPIDEPPFHGYAVTCGITFSFGGLKITTDGEVEDTTGRVIPGLFAGGELVGGIFYQNYLGGAGLMSGSVFGRIAGRSAGKYGAR